MRINRISSKGRPPVELQCADFEERCRQRRIRLTPQRRAVYRALASDTTHPTADSLYERVAEQMPDLSQATVYRTLEFLEAENLVRRVSGPEGVGRFDANLDRHQHLACRTCGSLTDVEVDDFMAMSLPEVAGFSVEKLDIRIVGRCDRCVARKTNDLTRSSNHAADS